MNKLFLSHSHGDQALADVLKGLIESCFPGHIEIKASSAAPSEGGIPMGSKWLEWIHEQVKDARFTVVLLTPKSVDKPWLMWEAGAVSGVALAMGQAATIIPLAYRLSLEQIPSPLQSLQAASGEDNESIRRVLETLRTATPLTPDALKRQVDAFVPAYLNDVVRALKETPPPLTETAVQDWLDRITYFEKTDRRSEVGQLHRAMVNVFAPGDNAWDTPLDVRLHRRLGDIYLFAKRSQDAARQFELALRLSPRDIFLLHKRGLSLLECGDEPGASAVLGQILAIDPGAAKASTEIVGLKGRLSWQKYQRGGDVADLRSARDAYADGLKANPDSHYMADNVGQLSLLLGEKDVAQEAFKTGLAALEKTGDQGYWAVATCASCHFGLGKRAEGLAALERIRTLKPEPAACDSIRRGLKRLHKGLGLDVRELDAWLVALGGP